MSKFLDIIFPPPPNNKPTSERLRWRNFIWVVMIPFAYAGGVLSESKLGTLSIIIAILIGLLQLRYIRYV